MRYLFVPIFVLASAGAVQAKEASSPTPSAASINYSLPSSNLKLSVGLILEECTGTVKVKPQISFSTSVGPNPHSQYRFALDGENLSSFWKNRKISIETYPHGAIKSLNGGLSDQTGSIISTIVKSVGAILALDSQPDQPISIANSCNQETLAALESSKASVKRIGELKQQLLSAPVTQLSSIKDAIDALAAEVARLQTNELRIDLDREFVLEKSRVGATLTWRRRDFTKWLKEPIAGDIGNPIVTDFVIGLCIAAENLVAGVLGCNKVATDAADVSATREDSLPAVSCPSDQSCRTTIVLREPKPASITVISLSDGFVGKPNGAAMKRGNIMISQWGELSYLALRTGFARSVNFAMGFDENGHKLSQTWDATARGASLVGALSAISDSAIAAGKSLEGEQVAEQKAEIDRITTLKNYNQAKHCEAVYAAGGFTCP